MTAEDKIAESEYNLDKLKNVDNPKDFQFELSNFLSSSRSILDHLLEDHRIKFGLSICGDLTMRTFTTEAKKTHNSHALKFINWLDDERRKLRINKPYGFLWAKRNHSVHRNTVKLDHGVFLEVGITPILIDEITDEIANGDRNAKKFAWRFFNENLNEDALVVCSNFLAHIKKIVDYSKSS